MTPWSGERWDTMERQWDYISREEIDRVDALDRALFFLDRNERQLLAFDLSRVEVTDSEFRWLVAALQEELVSGFSEAAALPDAEAALFSTPHWNQLQNKQVELIKRESSLLFQYDRYTIGCGILGMATSVFCAGPPLFFLFEDIEPVQVSWAITLFSMLLWILLATCLGRWGSDFLQLSKDSLVYRKWPGIPIKRRIPSSDILAFRHEKGRIAVDIKRNDGGKKTLHLGPYPRQHTSIGEEDAAKILKAFAAMRP